ncbi:hypothetical protein R77567_04806 [Ralstonia sp. LMG 32965]|uniref:Uncharacterized protein n=1 Tax=Ralstonia flatus TaxID=3058601 RepID=A0AAD2C314_9RALS|nr:hypothetical protein R77567_04806 [Ralstonia sp. LMG 32965]CAJ0905002.1 hypothetical protein R77564_05218 [Ralstonia sp. LMG 32965]
MLQTMLWRASTAWYSALAYWLPRSECSTKPGAGRRCCKAISSADTTSAAGMLGAIDQPTTRREYRSSTTARYSQPAPVRM